LIVENLKKFRHRHDTRALESIVSSVASTANIHDMKFEAVSLFGKRANNVRYLLGSIFELSDQCSVSVSLGLGFCELDEPCDSVFAPRGVCLESGVDIVWATRLGY
jgi:hypothetical protein